MSDSKSERGSKLQIRDEYYMPLYIQRKDENSPRLSHSEFWKQHAGLTSYSDLQEVFYMQVSKRYGAKRGESYSLIKNTNHSSKNVSIGKTAIYTTNCTLTIVRIDEKTQI